MPSSLNFELHTGPGGRAASDARRAAGAQPARLLLLGDFSGRGSGGAWTTKPGPAAARWSAKTRPVDIDNLDAVMQLMAPKLHLQIQGRSCDFEPQSLDDFHPDQLLQSLLPLQQGLARLKALQDPAQFSRAAAEWDALQGCARQAPAPAFASAAAAAAASASASTATPASAAGDLLSSLLGGKVQAAAGALASAASPAPPSGIEALLHSAVAGHVLPAAPAHQSAYVAAAQAALADDLRAVLHDPAFQALEGAWRGVQLLVSRLELGEKLELHLADAALPDLLGDLVTALGRVEATSLVSLLAGKNRDGGVAGAGPDGPHWRAAFGLFSFGGAAVDIGMLAALGTAAARALTPFVSMATAELVRAALAASDGEATAQLGWTTLRRSEVAPWLGLVSSPLLLRLPYGRQLEPVQHLDFEELSGADEPGQLLWGSGAIAAAAALGQSCLERVASVNAQTLDDLPALVLRADDDEAQLQACAGHYLSDAEAEKLLTTGLMPLLSHRRKCAVTLPRWQSIAEPLRALQGLSAA